MSLPARTCFNDNFYLSFLIVKVLILKNWAIMLCWELSHCRYHHNILPQTSSSSSLSFQVFSMWNKTAGIFVIHHKPKNLNINTNNVSPNKAKFIFWYVKRPNWVQHKCGCEVTFPKEMCRKIYKESGVLKAVVSSDM